jgi:transposase
LLHIPKSTLSNLLHRIIERIRDGHKIRGLKAIGVDEISYEKGRKYVTIVYNLDLSCVVWVGKGKGRETIDAFFANHLSDYQKNKIEWASCDMSETYIGAIQEHCPNATLVLDRFHIVKALNEAVNEVRKEEWRKADPGARIALKGLRWLLNKHSSKRTLEEAKALKALRNGNRRIHRAAILKDEFERFWLFGSIEKADEFLKAWMTTALKSRLEPIRKFVRTLKRHKNRMLPYVVSGITNAVAEGLNRVIKIVKNRASGFKNLHAYIDMIFLTVGDVDIPGRFPKIFRTV